MSVIHYEKRRELIRLEVGEARNDGDGVVTLWSLDRLILLFLQHAAQICTGVSVYLLSSPSVQKSCLPDVFPHDKSRLPAPS